MTILLSTFNGEQCVEALLHSLVDQTYPAIDILVRDDGSKDKTLAIIESFAAAYPNIKILKGENLGVTGSFMALLSEVRYGSPFMFCDQDDIWDDSKIQTFLIEYANQMKKVCL